MPCARTSAIQYLAMKRKKLDVAASMEAMRPNFAPRLPRETSRKTMDRRRRDTRDVRARMW